MQLTPFYKSLYWWLAWVAFIVLWLVVLAVFAPTTFMYRFVLWVPCVAVYFWLHQLGKKAQIEDDWKLPNTPRIPVE